MSKTVKNLSILLGLITVAFAGYYIFSERSATTLSFSESGPVMENMLANSQLFIARRQQLAEIQVNAEFFYDERFRSLRSFNTPIVEQPIGRADPFATVRPLPTDQF